MNRSFRWKLSLTYLVIIIVVLAASNLVTLYIVEKQYTQIIAESFLNEGELISQIIGSNVPDNKITEEQVESAISIAGETRITIVDQQGNVLGDSEIAVADYTNHKDRPEIAAALNGEVGQSVRTSTTTHKKMLYVAVPIECDGLIGVVRVAKSIADINTVFSPVADIMIGSALFIGLIVFIISMFIAARFSKPIKYLAEMVQEISHGKFKKRIDVKFNDEFQLLGDSINQMAENLERTIDYNYAVKNRLEAVLDNTVNGILMINNKDELVYANPVAMYLLAIDSSKIGRQYTDIIKNAELVNMVNQAKNGSKSLKKEVILQDQESTTFEANIVPVLKRENAYHPEILVVLNDISELKHLQQVRQDFVANISHALKTPVTTIKDFSEQLLKVKQQNEQVEQYSAHIYDEILRLDALINELLYLSRLDSGSVALNLKKQNLANIIENAIYIIKKKYADLALIIDFKTDDAQLEAIIDKDCILQVFLNLLENAVVHCNHDRRIEITLNKQGNKAYINIADHGEGIPIDEIPRVFERFYRVDKDRSRHPAGTGLGLAIVKHLVEIHQGQVGVTSELGRGSVFYIVLPLP